MEESQGHPLTTKASSLLGRRIFRFASVGAVSTTADILVYQLLYVLGVFVQVAATAGFLTGLTIGFFLNSRFVFKKERTAGRYIKYALSSLGGLLLTNAIIFLLYTNTHLVSALAAKLVAVAIVFFWNYTWSRYWAFR